MKRSTKLKMLRRAIGEYDSADYEGSLANKEHWKTMQNGKPLERELIFSKRYEVWVNPKEFYEADCDGSILKLIAAARKKQYA
jgi:hypothetical protein